MTKMDIPLLIILVTGVAVVVWIIRTPNDHGLSDRDECGEAFFNFIFAFVLMGMGVGVAALVQEFLLN